jgi:hypothetical protein
MTSIASVKRTLKLSKQSLANLSLFRSLPGVYSMDERQYSSRTWLAPVKYCAAAYVEENPDMELSDELLSQLKLSDPWNFMSCCAIPSYNPSSRIAQYGISCTGCQLAVESDNVPGYSDKERIFCYRDEVHSTESFLKHFAWCQQAQTLWISSGCGSKPPRNLPEACKRGGFFNQRE